MSVICIFYNGERFLAEAIESILAQTYRDFELLLVDDGSQDRSGAIAREYAARYAGRISYLHHPGHENRGMSASHNLGLSQARGELVAWCDHDDTWYDYKLAEQVALLDANPECGLVCGVLHYWSSWDGGADEYVLTGGLANTVMAPPETLARLYPVGEEPAVGTDAMARASLVSQVGGFEERFRIKYADQGLFVKLLMITPVYFSNRPWIRYRQHDRSFTQQSYDKRTALGHRWNFFAWLHRYVRERPGLVPRREMRKIRRELLILGFPALWKILWQLRRWRERLVSGPGGSPGWRLDPQSLPQPIADATKVDPPVKDQ